MRKLCSFALALLLLMTAFAGSALAAEEYRYATEPVNMRTGPSTKYKIITELKTGEQVEQIGSRSGNWSNVLWKGQRGFVFSKYLTEEAPAEAAAAPDAKELYTQFALSEYRGQNPNTILGSAWVDKSTNTFHLRVTRDADIEKITRDLEEIFNNPLARFKVERTSLPSYVTPAYLDELEATIQDRYAKLSRSRQKSIALAFAWYRPEEDRYVVALVDLDDAKERNFRRYVCDWEHLAFISGGPDLPMAG